MVASLRRVIVCPPDAAVSKEGPRKWNYRHAIDPLRVREQHDTFVTRLRAHLDIEVIPLADGGWTYLSDQTRIKVLIRKTCPTF